MVHAKTCTDSCRETDLNARALQRLTKKNAVSLQSQWTIKYRSCLDMDDCIQEDLLSCKQISLL